MGIKNTSWIQKIGLRSRHTGELAPFERKVYSQQGEDGIIEEIFNRIGTDSKFAVEFGVEDGSECNTRYLKEKGWSVLQMDGHDNNPPSIKQEYITAENINDLFAKYNVPENLDMLCIDIDSNDLWVWKAIDKKYRPRLVVIEYNATIAPSSSMSVAYDPKLTWDGTSYFGASLLALYRLARTRGYDLVYCNDNGVNAFFVRADLITDQLIRQTPISAYRGPNFGQSDKFGVMTGHPATTREFVEVDEDINPAVSKKNPKKR